jgi:hypothetical protein
MQSYLVKTKYKITRQAGDTGSVVFIVPATISMSTYHDVLFQVRDDRDRLLFEKETPTDIVVNSQTITVNLANDDTAEISGKYDWELQVSDGTDIATIGKGIFEIIAEIAR